jgi:hypothetical protein
VARANGFGAQRLSLTVRSNANQRVAPTMQHNLASAANGATAAGDGTNLVALIDDTEATNWAYLGALDAGVAGTQVTVRLDPSRSSWNVARIQVSAQLRTRLPADPGGDVNAQNRFSALRAFEIWTCEVKPGVDCTLDTHFRRVFVSPADAFPAIGPRPRAPDLLLREFRIPRTRATFVRLVVLTNQCTGAPAYQGEQDADPGAVSDCPGGSTQDDVVRAAELQVFQK